MAVLCDEGKARELEAQFHEDLRQCEEWSLAACERATRERGPLDSVYRLASPLL
jgi:hypothetical protein